MQCLAVNIYKIQISKLVQSIGNSTEIIVMPHDETSVGIGKRAKENEAVSLVRNDLKSQDNDRDLSDTCSEEDLIPYYRLPLNVLIEARRQDDLQPPILAP